MSQITVSHLTFAYDGACDNVFEDVSFVLDTDWRLGFTGRNGRGKTTFLKLLDGTLDSRGAVRAGVPVLYFPFPVEYPQDDTQAVLERLLPDCPAWRILRELNLLGVEQDVLYRPFYTMSNGEQTKILLASLFLHDGAFLLIDEPTNHLDAGGRRLLGEYLAQKRGYILVSHDRDLLDRCADHMLVLNRRDITVMQGNSPPGRKTNACRTSVNARKTNGWKRTSPGWARPRAAPSAGAAGPSGKSTPATAACGRTGVFWATRRPS